MEKKREETIQLPQRNFVVDTGKTKVEIGSDKDIDVICGPCVIDSKEMVMNTAKQLAELSQDRKRKRLNYSHITRYRMQYSA